jgi:hypothetical protein
MFFNSVLLNTMMYNYWRDQYNILSSLLDTNVCIRYLYLILTISYIHGRSKNGFQVCSQKSVMMVSPKISKRFKSREH